MHTPIRHLVVVACIAVLCLVLPAGAAMSQPVAPDNGSGQEGQPFSVTYSNPNGTVVTLPMPAQSSGAAACALPAPSLIAPINPTTITTLTPHFQWNATGAPAYAIEVSPNPDLSNPVIKTIWWDSSSEPTRSKLWHSNLAANTTYHWRTASVCSDRSQGPWSPTASFQVSNVTGPFPPAPAQVAPAAGAAVKSLDVEFVWGDVPGALGWQVRRYDTLSDAQNDQYAWEAWSSDYWRTSSTLNVDTDGTYYWRVLARFDAGWGSLSPVRSFTVSTFNYHTYLPALAR